MRAEQEDEPQADASAGPHEEEADYRFDPASLATPRRAGISAFMRVRNGADFIALAIESHLPHLDEIVVCHNRCTDDTVPILERLRERHPDKLKVFEYAPRVHPAGSALHRSTPWHSVHSLANYYNFALARTTRRVVMKLDDDHVAIEESVARITGAIRARDCRLGNRMHCFSGINLTLANGQLAPLDYRTFAGHGDHWYFEATPRTFFTKDRRFERLERRGLVREYHGLAYWHLKYLKEGEGFANYELDGNPGSRYHKQLEAYRRGRQPIGFDELAARCRARVEKESRWPLAWLRSLDDKRRLKFERARRFDPNETRRWLDRSASLVLARLTERGVGSTERGAELDQTRRHPGTATERGAPGGPSR